MHSDISELLRKFGARPPAPDFTSMKGCGCFLASGCGCQALQGLAWLPIAPALAAVPLLRVSLPHVIFQKTC
jgi:hypothetical protein